MMVHIKKLVIRVTCLAIEAAVVAVATYAVKRIVGGLQSRVQEQFKEKATDES